MSSEETTSSAGSEQADFVKAFQVLAEGERHATALEDQLTSMEAKIEALLAEAEKQQAEAQALKAQRSTETKKDEE